MNSTTPITKSERVALQNLLDGLYHYLETHIATNTRYRSGKLPVYNTNILFWISIEEALLKLPLEHRTILFQWWAISKEHTKHLTSYRTYKRICPTDTEGIKKLYKGVRYYQQKRGVLLRQEPLGTIAHQVIENFRGCGLF